MRIRDQYPAIVFRTRKLSVAFHRVYPSCITLDMTAAGGCLPEIFSSNARDGWRAVYTGKIDVTSKAKNFICTVYTRGVHIVSHDRKQALARMALFYRIALVLFISRNNLVG